MVLDAKTKYEKAMQGAKNLHGRMQKELSSVGVITARIRPKPGWGEAAADHLHKETELQKKGADGLMNLINDVRIELDDVGECTVANLAKWNEQSTKIEPATEGEEKSYKMYVFKELRELSKYRKVRMRGMHGCMSSTTVSQYIACSVRVVQTGFTIQHLCFMCIFLFFVRFSSIPSTAPFIHPHDLHPSLPSPIPVHPHPFPHKAGRKRGKCFGRGE